MRRCPSKPSPSTSTNPVDALDRPNPPTKVQQIPEIAPLEGSGVTPEFDLVEKWRIKCRAFFGRFSLEREIYKRIRRD
jgi:hypothetical protein